MAVKKPNRINKKFAKTSKDLAEILEISTQALYKHWMSRPGWPGKTKMGFNVQKCQEFIKAEKEKSADELSGENVDLKRRKLLLECDKLEEQLSALRSSTIPIQEHISEIAEYAHMTNGVFEKFRERVEAVMRDPKLMAELDRLIKRARERLVRVIDEK